MSRNSSRLFGAILAVDAASCLVLGLAFAAGAAPIARLTALPDNFVLGVGLVLLPVAALIGIAAAAPALRTRLAPVIVAGNALWVGASLAVLVFGIVAPNGLGTALVLGQAAAVAGVTLIELRLLRASAPSLAAAR